MFAGIHTSTARQVAGMASDHTTPSAGEGDEPFRLTPFHPAGVLFLFVGLLFGIYQGLAQFDAVPTVSWMTWSHLHYVTIGGFTQLVFGTLPQLVARKLDRPGPSRGYTWLNFLVLNGAFLALWVGRGWNEPLAFDLGLYAVFAIVLGLWVVLFGMVMRAEGDLAWDPTIGLYLVAVFVFLWGITYAYGLFAHVWDVPGGWLGLREGHVHANGWGFLGLTAVGTLYHLFPRLAGADLHSPQLQGYSFWLFATGIFPLITGPWLGMGRTVTMTGVVLFGSGYVLFLYTMIRTYLAGSRSGLALSVLSAQFWLLAPAGFAPFVIFGIEWVDPALIERGALHWFFVGWALPIALGGLILFARNLSCPVHGRPGRPDGEGPALLITERIRSSMPTWLVLVWNVAVLVVGVGFFYQNTDWALALLGPGYTVIAVVWGYQLLRAVSLRRSAVRGSAAAAVD